MDGWLDRSTVDLGGMAIKSLIARRQDCSGASFRDKDVLAILRCCGNRRSIIKCSDIDPNPIGPTLECKGQLGSAVGAKMDVYIFATSF